MISHSRPTGDYRQGQLHRASVCGWHVPDSRREPGICQVEARNFLQPVQAIAAQTTARKAMAAVVRDS